MRKTKLLFVALAALTVIPACNPTVGNDSSASSLVVTGFKLDGQDKSGVFADVVDDSGNAKDFLLFIKLQSIVKNKDGVPSNFYSIQIQGYDVSFVRIDNVRTEPGVTVPFPRTFTVSGFLSPGGSDDIELLLLPREATLQTPLRELWFTNNRIYTNMTVRVFGQDLVENNVSASGFIEIDFGDFAG